MSMNIPEETIRKAREVVRITASQMHDNDDFDAVFDRVTQTIASALHSAQMEERERERDRLSNLLDPEIGLPSDYLLRRVHADLEMRGRKNSAFAVTVHHRNIVLSAIATAIRTTKAD